MMRKGLWSPDEDERLVRCIAKYVNGSWSDIARKAGLDRCGKSCRRRWMNHLRPDLKRGRFSMEEINLIIQLQEVLGNRWSDIASHLEGRTDNDVKNLWNTQIKKRLPQLKSQFKLLLAAADHHHHHPGHDGSHDQYLHDQGSNSPAPVLNDQAASAFHMIDACHGVLTDQASSMFSTLLADGSSDQEEFLNKTWDNIAPLSIHDPSMSSHLIPGYNHHNGYEINNQASINGSKPAAKASVMIGSSSNCASTAYSMAITGADHHKLANINGSSYCFTNQSWQDSINSVHEINLVPVKTEQCIAGQINKLDSLPMPFNLKHIAASEQAAISSTDKCDRSPFMLSNSVCAPTSGKMNGCRFSNRKLDDDGSSLVDMVMSCLESKEMNRSAHDHLMIDSDQLSSRLKNSSSGSVAVPEARANYSCGSNFSVESNSCVLLGNKLSGADDNQNVMDQQECVSTLTVINNACKAAISSSTDDDYDDDIAHPRHLQQRRRHGHLQHCSNDHHQQIIHIQTTDHHAPIAAVATNPDHYTLDHLAMQSELWEMNHDQINDSIELIHTACTIDAHFADWPCNNANNDKHSFADNSNYNLPSARNGIFCDEGL